MSFFEATWAADNNPKPEPRKTSLSSKPETLKSVSSEPEAPNPKMQNVIFHWGRRGTRPGGS